MRKIRRIVLSAIVLACGISLGVSFALAIEKPKNYPERSVEVVVGCGAGGAATSSPAPPAPRPERS